MIKIKVIAGSSRPGRFNIQPATWIFNLLKERTDIEAEFIDLKEINLPFLDEPDLPSMHKYTKDHTKAWSTKIEEADGFIIVTPEYNYSIPPVLKNALDFIYDEWNYKPVSFISYGGPGGGARSVEQLRGVSAGLRMFDLREQILMVNYSENLDEQGNYKFTEKQIGMAKSIIDNLIFWATKMKPAREEWRAKQVAHK